MDISNTNNSTPGRANLFNPNFLIESSKTKNNLNHNYNAYIHRCPRPPRRP